MWFPGGNLVGWGPSGNQGVSTRFSRWFSPGSHVVVPTWSPPGSNLAHTWFPPWFPTSPHLVRFTRGSPLVPTWFTLGPHVVPTWSPRGSHLAPRCEPGEPGWNRVGTRSGPSGNQVGARWEQGGSHPHNLVHTWFPLGPHIGHICSPLASQVVTPWSPRGSYTPPPPLPTVRRVCCHFGPSDG